MLGPSSISAGWLLIPTRLLICRRRLLPELRKRGIVTKLRQLGTGRTIGGIPFSRGPLADLLRNRFYLGEVVYRGKVCPGEHPAIVDRELFEAVQLQLAQQHRTFVTRRAGSQALLLGKLFDDRGNRMSPSHANKRGVRYRYYVSAALAQAKPEAAGLVKRVAAAEVEQRVLQALREYYPDLADTDDRELVERSVERIVLGPTAIEVILTELATRAEPITIPWSRTAMKRQREILLPNASVLEHRPVRAETRATLVRSIALGRRWLDELIRGSISGPEAIAAREGCSKRRVNMTLSLAFLAPDLVRAAVEGRLPHGVGVSRFDALMKWSRQWTLIGLQP
jgi:hypothetical protein